jgi:hypothetical protein
MFKRTVVTLGTCLALGVAGAANADLFLFNPNGTGAGGALQATTLDWLPGNTLAVGGAPIAPGTIITDFFQANLNSVVNGNTNLFSNGTNNQFFTVVAGFSEQTVTASIQNGCGSANFDNTAATQYLPSFCRICAQPGAGNDLTGAGFACTDQNAILTGTLTDIIGANVSVNFNNATVPLDQFNGDNWSNQQSVTSTGAANILVTVTGVNTGYFPGLNIGTQIITALTNTSLVTPFDQQNPSYCLSTATNSSTSGTTTCNNGSIQSFGTLGAVNGLNGPNFLFQADANTTIRVATVPEPASLGLLGLGLAGAAVVIRRRKGQQV